MNVWMAIGIGAEQDNLFRLKPFGDLANKAANGGGADPAGRRAALIVVWQGRFRSLEHVLHCNEALLRPRLKARFWTIAEAFIRLGSSLATFLDTFTPPVRMALGRGDFGRVSPESRSDA